MFRKIGIDVSVHGVFIISHVNEIHVQFVFILFKNICICQHSIGCPLLIQIIDSVKIQIGGAAANNISAGQYGNCIVVIVIGEKNGVRRCVFADIFGCGNLIGGKKLIPVSRNTGKDLAKQCEKACVQ